MKDVAILLIHGFGGTRVELYPLYNYLTEKGYTVSLPVLKGHESEFKELSKTKYYDWINSALTELEGLKKKFKKVVVIGFSMGGLIAVNLYNQENFEGLITINTPVYYWDIKRICMNLLGDFNTYFKRYFKQSTNKPIPALLEFQRLLTRTKPMFKYIKCPALIMQAMDDDTVNPKSADYIFEQLSGSKTIKRYPSGGHVIFSNECCADICNTINDFCENLK